MSFTWVLFLQVLLIGASLAMDAFAVSVTDGLCYHNLNKRKAVVMPCNFRRFSGGNAYVGVFCSLRAWKSF